MELLTFELKIYKILTTLAFICSTLHGSKSQSSPPAGKCVNDAIFVSDPNPCTRQYYRCESNTWGKSICVAGFFNTTTKECIPKSERCQNIGILDRALPQVNQTTATTADRCAQSFLCPKDLTEKFIYPDWSSKDCDRFYQCERGVLRVGTCNQGVYKYYNPRTFSCEENASRTNICLFRLQTELGGI